MMGFLFPFITFYYIKRVFYAPLFYFYKFESYVFCFFLRVILRILICILDIIKYNSNWYCYPPEEKYKVL